MPKKPPQGDKAHSFVQTISYADGRPVEYEAVVRREIIGSYGTKRAAALAVKDRLNNTKQRRKNIASSGNDHAVRAAE